MFKKPLIVSGRISMRGKRSPMSLHTQTHWVQEKTYSKPFQTCTSPGHFLRCNWQTPYDYCNLPGRPLGIITKVGHGNSYPGGLLLMPYQSWWCYTDIFRISCYASYHGAHLHGISKHNFISFWGKVNDWILSSFSWLHFGHYKATTKFSL